MAIIIPVTALIGDVEWNTNSLNPDRALTPLFGNGAGAFRIGKNSVVFIKIGKKFKVLCIEVFIVRLIQLTWYYHIFRGTTQ